MYKTKWTQLDKIEAIKEADNCIEKSIANIKKKYNEILTRADFKLITDDVDYMKIYVECKKRQYADYDEIVAINIKGRIERYPAD